MPEIHVPLDSPSEDLYFFTHFGKDYDITAAYWSFHEAPSEWATREAYPTVHTTNNVRYGRHVERMLLTMTHIIEPVL